MAKNLALQLELNAKDKASRVVKKTADNIKQSEKAIEQTVKAGAARQQALLKQTDRLTEQSYRLRRQAAHTAEQARATLGIRSEQRIQAEINRTRNAYLRLKASGVASARELANAHLKATQEIKRLNAEMGKTPKATFGQRLGSLGQGAMGVGAGLMAGAMVMRNPVAKAMSYDRELAMVANTAYAERDVAGRIEGKKALHNAVKTSVESAGGTKEDALASLNTLIASGVVDAKTAQSLLPQIQKASVATGASPEDVAKILISSIQQMGIDASLASVVLDKATAAGEAGNFELADMARWLPQEMAAARSAGLMGMGGLEALLIANQQARVTAGTSDEAGNNVVNLLSKITAKETKERFRKLDYVDAKGRSREINYIASMEAYQKKGKNPLEAFMAIMDDVIGNNKDYKALQAKLKNAKGGDQKTLLDQMANLVEGTAIGQIISDRQALMALLGIRNNITLGKEVKQQIDNSEGAVDKSHAVIADTNDYKVESLKSTAEFAQMESLKGFNNVLGEASQTLSEYAKAYPELTVSLVGAGTAVAALGAAALAAAGSVRLFGRKQAGDGVGDLVERGIETGKKGGKSGRFGGLGKGIKLGRVLGATGTFTVMAAIAEQRPKLAAQNEALQEKREAIQTDFYRTMPMKESVFKYGVPTPKAPETNKPPLYGGFALAALAQDKPIAEARLAQGTLTQADFASRLERNQRLMASLSQPPTLRYAPLVSAPQLSPVANSTLAEPSKAVDTLKNQVEQVNQATNAMRPTLTNHHEILSNYQADFAQFGQTISDGLQAALQAHQSVIQNHIWVELDGRAVAESVSETLHREFARG